MKTNGKGEYYYFRMRDLRCEYPMYDTTDGQSSHYCGSHAAVLQIVDGYGETNRATPLCNMHAFASQKEIIYSFGEDRVERKLT